MSQASKARRESSLCSGDDPQVDGRTVQMSPEMFAQEVDIFPQCELIQQLDATSTLLEGLTGVETGTPATGASTADDGEASELSIEEYMTALLARAQGPRSSNPFRAESVPEPVPAEASVVPEECTIPAATESTRKQSQTPECRNAISEMREVANISSRSSITVHQGHQLVFALQNKLTVILLSVAASIALASLSDETRSWTFLAAVIALVLAATWTMQYFRLARRLGRLCLPHSGDPATEIDRDAPAVS